MLSFLLIANNLGITPTGVIRNRGNRTRVLSKAGFGTACSFLKITDFNLTLPICKGTTSAFSMFCQGHDHLVGMVESLIRGRRTLVDFISL